MNIALEHTMALAMNSSNIRANDCSVLPRGTSIFGLSLVTPHKPLSYTIPDSLLGDRDERMSFLAQSGNAHTLYIRSVSPE